MAYSGPEFWRELARRFHVFASEGQSIQPVQLNADDRLAMEAYQEVLEFMDGPMWSAAVAVMKENGISGYVGFGSGAFEVALTHQGIGRVEGGVLMRSLEEGTDLTLGRHILRAVGGSPADVERYIVDQLDALARTLEGFCATSGT